MTTPEENMAIVRSAYEDGINVGDIQRHIDAFAPGYVNHFAGRDLDAEAFDKVYEEFLAGFPDLNTTIADIFATGNMVAVRHRYRGTHTGTWAGFPATGIAVDIPAHDIYRMTDDGQIAEEWVVMDQLLLLQQLGIIPRREEA